MYRGPLNRYQTFVMSAKRGRPVAMSGCTFAWNPEKLPPSNTPEEPIFPLLFL